MRKRIITYVLFLIAALVSINASASNPYYFTSGLTWESTESSTSFIPILEWKSIVELGKESVSNNHHYFEILQSLYYKDDKYQDTYRKLKGYTYMENDIVYIGKPDKDKPDWHIMYNFGLKPGEGCLCYNLVNLHSDLQWESMFVYCSSIRKDEANPEWELMEILVFEDESMDHCIRTGIWIKELGSAHGFLHNIDFCKDGGGGILSEVRYNDTILYQEAQSNINSSTENKYSITIIENTLEIDGLKGDKFIQIYDIDGNLICYRNCTTSKMTIPVPSNKLKIIKIDNRIFKIK